MSLVGSTEGGRPLDGGVGAAAVVLMALDRDELRADLPYGLVGGRCCRRGCSPRSTRR